MNQDRVYRFKDYRIDLFERSVTKAGQPLDIEGRAFDVLALLVERAGETVTKDEFLNGVWNTLDITEASLFIQISQLRRKLGHAADNRLIVTRHRLGYQFVARVSKVGERV